MLLFSSDYTSPIILHNISSVAVIKATRDLQRDLRRISGQAHGFAWMQNSLQQGIHIQIVPDGVPEMYSVQVEDAWVQITGSDVLGVIYGIYAFSEQCLGVLPMHCFMDIFPKNKSCLSIPPQRFSSCPQKVRFRGWFLNDEDLLSQFKSGGKRNIDYPFYQSVMHTDVLDMVLEAALRSQINLIIPGSFIDLANPAEEALVQAVCERGLYVSQHHVEPVGVSYFAAEGYLKAHNIDEPISFCSNRDRMVEIWRFYIAKWAKYGDRVVWQLGLRGKGDQAVWQADPSAPSDFQSRGQIITDAISTQHQIICAALKRDDFYSTATLWNEGSMLYAQGFLELPPNTIVIFSDFGISQMFGGDFYTTPRFPDRQYGIYYHVAFWSLGPHLAEGCDPRKMEYCYKAAYDKGSLAYAILNVSNIRPVHVSVLLNSRLLHAPDKFCADAALGDFCRRVFGQKWEEIFQLYRSYYAAFADMGKEPLLEASKAWHFYYQDHKQLPFLENPGTDGQIAWVGKNALRGWSSPGGHPLNEALLCKLTGSAQRFQELYMTLQKTQQGLSREQSEYLDKFLGYQTLHMYLLTQWAIGCVHITRENTPIQDKRQWYKTACDAMEALLTERKILEQGAWQGWHRGEKKINLLGLYETTKNVYNRIMQEENN